MIKRNELETMVMFLCSYRHFPKQMAGKTIFFSQIIKLILVWQFFIVPLFKTKNGQASTDMLILCGKIWILLPKVCTYTLQTYNTTEIIILQVSKHQLRLILDIFCENLDQFNTILQDILTKCALRVSMINLNVYFNI